jgi:hypothetical protein
MMSLKRVYQKPEKQDGFRVLVDRFWPRGLTKEKARVDLWLKDLAPSDQLRKWYGHDPSKWEEFTRGEGHPALRKEGQEVQQCGGFNGISWQKQEEKTDKHENPKEIYYFNPGQMAFA